MDSFKKEYECDQKDVLGSGAFAEVFRGKRLSDDVGVAVKIIDKPRPSARDFGEKNEAIRREMDIMRSLDHPDIVQMLGKFENDRTCIIVQELVTGGELFDYLTQKETLDERVAVEFLQQLLGAMAYIHDKLSIMHLDIKPENLLLNAAQTQLKLIDFGLAHRYSASRPLKKMIGTPEFVSPEICEFNPITPAADVWAMGILTYLMLTGYSPFLGDDDGETLANVSAGEPPDFEDEEIVGALSPNSLEFLKSCLQPRVTKRPTASQCLSHPWMKTLEAGETHTSVSLPTKRLREMTARRRFRDAARAIRFANRIKRLSTCGSS